MSDTNQPVISKENQPTIIAVIFILALLSLAFSLYNNRKITKVAQFYGQVSVIQARKTAQTQDQANTIAALETRLKAVEEQLVAAQVAPEEPTEE